jgi:hypothetical protein
MKQFNIPFPHKDELSDYALSTNTNGLFEKTYFVFLFNRKKTWYIFNIIELLIIYDYFNIY